MSQHSVVDLTGPSQESAGAAWQGSLIDCVLAKFGGVHGLALPQHQLICRQREDTLNLLLCGMVSLSDLENDATCRAAAQLQEEWNDEDDRLEEQRAQLVREQDEEEHEWLKERMKAATLHAPGPSPLLASVSL
jgi:hypothetical protein